MRLNPKKLNSLIESLSLIKTNHGFTRKHNCYGSSFQRIQMSNAFLFFGSFAALLGRHHLTELNRVSGTMTKHATATIGLTLDFNLNVCSLANCNSLIEQLQHSSAPPKPQSAARWV
jgi:hypothetical protein